MKKILTLFFILTAFSSFAQEVRFNSSTNSQYKSNLSSGSSSSSSSMQSTIRGSNTQGKIIENSSPYSDRGSAGRYSYSGTESGGNWNSDYEYLSNGVKQNIHSYGTVTPNGTMVEEVIIYKSR